LAEIEAQLCDPQHWQNAPEHVERKCTAPRLPSAKGSHRDAQSSVWPARAHTLIGGGYRVAAFGASTGCLALVAPRCSFGGKLDASRTRPTVPSSLCLRGPGRVSAQLSADAKVVALPLYCIFQPSAKWGDVRKAALGRRILGGDQGPPVSPVGAARADSGSPWKRYGILYPLVPSKPSPESSKVTRSADPSARAVGFASSHSCLARSDGPAARA